ncbi:hypothetical protein EMIT040CA3_10445 [Bacillus pseudomycoides]
MLFDRYEKRRSVSGFALMVLLFLSHLYFIIRKKFLIRLWKWNYGKLRIETIRLDYRRERGEEDDEISISETIYI